MKHLHVSLLGSTLALTLIAGTAHASVNKQGLHMQGLHMQGLHMQGLHMQSTSLDPMALSGFRLPNGSTPTSTYLYNGNVLRAYNGATLVSDAGLIGSTFQAWLSLEDGTKRQITVSIDAVAADGSMNSMVCDPQQSRFVVNCGRGYNQNYGMKLYKLHYLLNSDPTQSGYLCGGDQNAMFFEGEWDSAGTWHAAPGKITAACTTGVITKCARSWGYKPWATMVNKNGANADMREYHQLCTRAARADYSGMGVSFTINGTPVDLIDNGGFNLQALSADLTSMNLETTERFESFFTPETLVPNSIKPDYWARFMAGFRLQALPLAEGYDEIDWNGDTPKLAFSDNAPVSDWLSFMQTRYLSTGEAELVVYDPFWSKVGTSVQSGTTADAENYRVGSCVPASNDAPEVAFRWTAPQSGTYRFDTFGSTYDTVLYLYSNHAEVACDDDVLSLPYPQRRQSQTDLAVTAGQEVEIFVDGYGSASGHYQLNITKL